MNLTTVVALLLAGSGLTVRIPLTVSVVDDNNGRLPGVAIHITNAVPWEPAVDVRGTTDRIGQLRDITLAPGLYRVTSRLQGFHDAVAFVDLDAAATVQLVSPVRAIYECVVGLSHLRIEGSIRERSGGVLVASPVLIDSRDGERTLIHTSGGRFVAGECNPPITTADEVHVDIQGVGTQLVKARGVDPSTMSWDLVVDIPPAFAERLARRYVPVRREAALAAGEVLVAVMTSMGEFTIAVDTARAPVTASNFLAYVDARMYDGGRFHRATRPDNYEAAPPNRPMMQLIQGGLNAARVRESRPAIPLERTTVTGLRHTVGTVSMARGTPDSATSDFFVLLDDQPSLDYGGRRFDDGQGAAAFGRIVTGLEVVRRIQGEPVRGQSLHPPVTIIAARRVK